ncbi:MAG: alpha/beta hydrolase, partial [Kaistella sp.]
LITDWFFGIDSKAEKQLLKRILKETNPQFLGWAINEIANWENEFQPHNCIHIHGNKDRIIPIQNVQADFVIQNGGHFMNVNKSKEIERIIKQICK